MADKITERVIPNAPKGLSIRAKIGLIIAIIAAVSGFGAIVMLWTQVSATLTSEVEKRGVSMASGLASSVVNPILTESKGILKKLGDRVMQQEAVQYVVVANDEGTVLFSSLGNLPPAVRSVVQTTARKTHLATQRLDLGRAGVINVAAPVVEGTVGTVHVGMSMSAISGWVVRTVGFLAALTAVMVIAAAVIGNRVANAYIARPLQEVVTVAESVGRGDLSREVKVLSQDEVGQLGTTFNNTVRRLRKLVQTEEERNAMQRQVMDLLSIVSAAAEGDLSKEAQVTADTLGSLADAFNLMVNGLAGLVEQVRSASLEIENATAGILAGSDTMRRGGEEQGRHITGASQVVNAMSRSMQQVADNAEVAAGASAKATEAALKGEGAVAETIKGMHRIRGTVQGTSKKIKSLGERSMEIGAIVEVINDIATQTNLLALNAAIEAARAGEHGKGFAVVADEVRKLAERSAKATKDIANLVKGIQVETNEVVTAMDEGIHEVEEGTRLADSAGATLKEIETMVQKTATSVTDISGAARQQVKATEGVVQTMEAISGVTRQTSEGIEKTVSTIRALADLSERLVEAVGRFKIADADVPVEEEGIHVAAHTSEKDLDLGFLGKQ